LKHPFVVVPTAIYCAIRQYMIDKWPYKVRGWSRVTVAPEPQTTAGLAAGPLAGLRVVEISSFVAAPLGGMTLAQLGADVIRVDPPGGAARGARA
jgi:hypothetical protein